HVAEINAGEADGDPPPVRHPELLDENAPVEVNPVTAKPDQRSDSEDSDQRQDPGLMTLQAELRGDSALARHRRRLGGRMRVAFVAQRKAAVIFMDHASDVGTRLAIR